MASEKTTVSGAPVPQMAACEAVEVVSVAEQSVIVLWLHGGPARSTVGGDWRSLVHKTKDECLGRLEARSGKSVNQ